MKKEMKYIELKTGYNDNGPAWIALVSFSKTGQTIYFDGKSLKKIKRGGIGSNYSNLENEEEYWISGVKRDGQDRHYSGNGIIQIEENLVSEYLKFVKKDKLNLKKFQVISSLNSKFHSDFHNQENPDYNYVFNLAFPDKEENYPAGELTFQEVQELAELDCSELIYGITWGNGFVNDLVKTNLSLLCESNERGHYFNPALAKVIYERLHNELHAVSFSGKKINKIYQRVLDIFSEAKEKNMGLSVTQV